MNHKIPLNEITANIIDAACKVHSTVGPGLLESAYEAILARELANRGLSVERQKPFPICWDGETLPVGLLLHFGQARMKDGIKRIANDTLSQEDRLS